MNKIRKLEVGCGNKPREGYEHNDVLDAEFIEYVCPAWELPISDPVFSEVYSRHFFEHLTPEKARVTLAKWKSILAPGGVIHMILPNLEYHCRQLTMPGMSKFLKTRTNEEHALGSIYGWLENGDPYEHKWGYTKKTLSSFLQSCDFSNIKFIDCRECDIEVIFY